MLSRRVVEKRTISCPFLDSNLDRSNYTDYDSPDLSEKKYKNILGLRSGKGEFDGTGLRDMSRCTRWEFSFGRTRVPQGTRKSCIPTVRMVTAGPFRMAVPLYQTVRHYSLEHSNNLNLFCFQLINWPNHQVVCFRCSAVHKTCFSTRHRQRCLNALHAAHVMGSRAGDDDEWGDNASRIPDEFPATRVIRILRET